MYVCCKQIKKGYTDRISYCSRADYGPGIEDKWRHTYPYVPTSYYYNNPAMPRHNPESIGECGQEIISRI